MSNKLEFGYIVDLLTSNFLKQICPEDFDKSNIRFVSPGARIRKMDEKPKFFRLQIENPAIQIGTDELVVPIYNAGSIASDYFKIGDKRFAIELSYYSDKLSPEFKKRFEDLCSSTSVLPESKSMVHGSKKMYYKLSLREGEFYSDDDQVLLTNEDLNILFKFDRFALV